MLSVMMIHQMASYLCICQFIQCLLIGKKKNKTVI
uniref:Uncharacterized protein n=1 Tax=Rhizophora mucronata TaxID=61149 RepID=A0A2P2QGG5_RHIMU